MKKNTWGCVILVGIFGWLFAGTGAAEIRVGGGMEYFTVKTNVIDLQNRFFSTRIQSTLAVAKIEYLAGPWDLEVSGAYSDWATSGEWQGTNIITLADNNFGNAWQQHEAVKLAYALRENLLIGGKYSQQSLLHYPGMTTDFVYLDYHIRTAELSLSYLPLRAKDTNISCTLAYAPWAYLEIYQNTHADPEIDVIHQYNSAGTGTQWSGEIELRYANASGWGLNIIYQVGWTRFVAPRDLTEFTLRSGSLTGFLWLGF